MQRSNHFRRHARGSGHWHRPHFRWGTAQAVGPVMIGSPAGAGHRPRGRDPVTVDATERRGL
ncbi:MAG: DUF1589 domain-containing protein [Xanthobacteraceae bacterium]